MKVHFCPLDPVCRQVLTGPIGPPPWRVTVWTKHHQVGVALRKRDLFAGRVNSKYKWFYIERKA